MRLTEIYKLLEKTMYYDDKVFTIDEMKVLLMVFKQFVNPSEKLRSVINELENYVKENKHPYIQGIVNELGEESRDVVDQLNDMAVHVGHAVNKQYLVSAIKKIINTLQTKA